MSRTLTRATEIETTESLVLVPAKLPGDYVLGLADHELIGELMDSIGELTDVLGGDEVTDVLYRLVEEAFERWAPEEAYWRAERERLDYMEDEDTIGWELASRVDGAERRAVARILAQAKARRRIETLEAKSDA